MDEHYQGFIDTCARFGMAKQAADLLYKQAIGAEKIFGAARKAMQSGKSLKDVVINGKRLADQATWMSKANRMFDPSKASQLENMLKINLGYGKSYSPEVVQRFKSFLNPATEGAAAAPAARVTAAPAAAKPPKLPAAPRRIKIRPGTVAQYMADRQAALAASQRLQEISKSLGRNGGWGWHYTSPASTVRQQALSEIAGGKAKAPVTPAAAVEETAAKAQARKAVEQQAKANAKTTAQAKANAAAKGEQAAAEGAETAAQQDMANQALNEMAAVGNPGGPGWYSQFLGSNPYLATAAIGVPSFALGSYWASRRQ